MVILEVLLALFTILVLLVLVMPSKPRKSKTARTLVVLGSGEHGAENTHHPLSCSRTHAYTHFPSPLFRLWF